VLVTKIRPFETTGLAMVPAGQAQSWRKLLAALVVSASPGFALPRA
jgi:hypothetical protein